MDPQIVAAIKAMLSTRCPACHSPQYRACHGTPKGQFHPARARRASVKTKMSIIDGGLAA